MNEKEVIEWRKINFLKNIQIKNIVDTLIDEHRTSTGNSESWANILKKDLREVLSKGALEYYQLIPAFFKDRKDREWDEDRKKRTAEVLKTIEDSDMIEPRSEDDDEDYEELKASGFIVSPDHLSEDEGEDYIAEPDSLHSHHLNPTSATDVVYITDEESDDEEEKKEDAHEDLLNLFLDEEKKEKPKIKFESGIEVKKRFREEQEEKEKKKKKKKKERNEISFTKQDEIKKENVKKLKVLQNVKTKEISSVKENVDQSKTVDIKNNEMIEKTKKFIKRITDWTILTEDIASGDMWVTTNGGASNLYEIDKEKYVQENIIERKEKKKLPNIVIPEKTPLYTPNPYLDPVVVKKEVTVVVDKILLPETLVTEEMAEKIIEDTSEYTKISMIGSFYYLVNKKQMKIIYPIDKVTFDKYKIPVKIQ